MPGLQTFLLSEHTLVRESPLYQAQYVFGLIKTHGSVLAAKKTA